MAERQPAQRRAGVLDDIGDWMARRNADVHHFARDAEATGRKAWVQATRTGENLAAMRSSDLAVLGAKMLKGGGPPSHARTQARPQTKNPAAESAPENSGLPDYVGKIAVGMVARPTGAVVGAARGVKHMAEDLVESVNFASRLLDPLDAQYSPRGEAAWDQVANAGGRTFEYVKNGVSNPGAVVGDVDHALHNLRGKINPSATPMADSMGGEFRRNYEIGKNQGEFAVDVGATVRSGGAVKRLAGVGALSKDALMAKFLEQGFNPAQASYLAEPYMGMGHHYVPRSFRIREAAKGPPLPKAIIGWRLPQAVSDSAFNVLKPRGISRGNFYELHYKVDRSFGGTRLPAKEGGGTWSGKDLGLKKYNKAGRVWHGSPGPLKAAVGGGAAAGSAWAYDRFDEEKP